MQRLVLMLWILSCYCAAVADDKSSLYDEKTFRGLTEDKRAYRVGDALTVLVFESSSASTSAETETEKKGGVKLGLKTHKRDQSAALTLSDDFSGSGTIQRSGKLAAQITVRVSAVMTNGDLQVAGRQIIEVNNEKQEIALSGRVRPRDIGELNTVVSSRLADARITYVGEGLLGEKQKPGFISRLLSWMGLL
jgi:flagellar L-ring protein precursor FlgH